MDDDLMQYGAMLESTPAAGQTEPAPREPSGEPDRFPDVEAIEGDFWSARPSLTAIYGAALAQMVAPWAVLGHCAARVLAYVPPQVRLPGLIGSRNKGGSLNWYAVTVVRSGGGKSAAAGLAADLIAHSAPTRYLGSGEGLIETYWPAFKLSNSDDDFDLPDNGEPKAFVFEADEIDGMAAMGARSGSTLMPFIRTAFTGGALAAGYKGRTGQIIPANEYRMTLVVNAQPERCAAILADAAGGTPQRFMWFPALDRRITPENSRDDYQVGALQIASNFSGASIIAIPPSVTRFIKEQRAANANPDRDSGLDGHAVFCREKFAYALAVMDGRTYMNEEDWRLSGIASQVSDVMRQWVAGQVEAGHRERASEKGRLRGVESNASDEERGLLAMERQTRVAKWIDRKLREIGPLLLRDLQSRAPKASRPYLVGTLAAMQEADRVAQVDGRWELR